jgi:hypothetical protein
MMLKINEMIEARQAQEQLRQDDDDNEDNDEEDEQGEDDEEGDFEENGEGEEEEEVEVEEVGEEVEEEEDGLNERCNGAVVSGEEEIEIECVSPDYQHASQDMYMYEEKEDDINVIDVDTLYRVVDATSDGAVFDEFFDSTEI